MSNYEFDRDIYKFLAQWKEDCARRKIALEVRGARQIGKTHSIQKFINENFRKVYELNMFVDDERAHVEEVRQNRSRPRDPLGIVSALFPDFEDASDAVLFFDEVQESSFLYNLIRPINRELKCQLILSGSFLGHTLNRNFVTPTGDIMTKNMYSLSFPEFLGAVGERSLYEQADLLGGSDSGVYERLKKAFLMYLQIGGHPKVVEEVLDKKDIDFVRGEIEKLINTFYNESKRYFDDILDITRLRTLMVAMANLLLRDKRGSLNVSYELEKIMNNSTRQSILKSLSWFYESGIIEPCDRVNDCDWSNITPTCRYYFSDIGVANYFYRQVPLQTENIYGELCESFAYSCLRDMGGPIQKTPHFATHGDDELDYMFSVRSGGKIVSVGIEVKGGKSAGNSAMRLLEKGKINYLVNAKLDTRGGRTGNIFTIPLTLLGRFNIFDYIPDDDEIERQRTQEFLTNGEFNYKPQF